MSIGISAIEFYLPEKVLSNDFFEYAKNDFLEEKVGIKERRIAADDEYTSTMSVKAINALLSKNNIDRNSIDFLILCTLTPDHPLPQTSSKLQHCCELPMTTYTMDIRMGCTGFVHALSVAYSLINSLGYKRGLVVTADKFSMYLSYKDYTVDTLFSDNATAILVEKDPKLFEVINFDFGTDGSGEEHIIVPAGGCKLPITEKTGEFESVKPGVERSKNYLYMNGRQVMKFANFTVPPSISRTLEKNNLTVDSIDWLVLHQANKLMLEDIGERLHVPKEKNYINLWDKGNTTASSIPIAMNEIADGGTRVKKGGYWVACGFGLGLAWGTVLLKCLKDK